MNLLVLVPAIVVATPAVILARRALTVRTWHRAPGVVLSAELLPVSFPGKPNRSLRPVIRYAYTVNGTEYRSDVFSHAMQSGGVDEDAAQRIMDRYPAGARVTVRHHPTEPHLACLSVTFGAMGWTLTALSCLLLLLALIL